MLELANWRINSWCLSKIIAPGPVKPVFRLKLLTPTCPKYLTIIIIPRINPFPLMLLLTKPRSRKRNEKRGKIRKRMEKVKVSHLKIPCPFFNPHAVGRDSWPTFANFNFRSLALTFISSFDHNSSRRKGSRNIF